jgi:hypothetical protein
MQPAERFSIAQRVIANLANVSPEFGPSAFGPIVASRITAAITAIDAAAAVAESPLLVNDLLPGIDLIVTRDYSQPAPRAAVDAPSLESIWDADSVATDWIGAVADLATDAFARARSTQDGPAVAYHQGQDGLHYFLFETSTRAQALAQLGVEEADVVPVSQAHAALDTAL